MASLAATIITVGSLAGGANGAVLVDFASMGTVANYSGNADFTVTTYGGAETDINLHPHIQGGYLLNSSDPNVVNNAYPTEDIIEFAFNTGLDSITVNLFWAGNNGYGMTITSYDKFNNLLETFGYIDGTPTYLFDSTAEIHTIRTDSKAQSIGNRDWWYGVTSISYTAVPEPSLSFLLGLGALGFIARRRKNS